MYGFPVRRAGSVSFRAAFVLLATCLLAQAPCGAADETFTVRHVSETRDEVDLNGVWHFTPVAGGDERGPAGGWGRVRVPGNWNEPGAVLSADPSWGNWKPTETAAAWYERALTVPADWNGRAIVLDVDRVSTDAVVYVDGVKAGEVNWPGGEVDVTDVIKPGQAQRLRVRVIATDNKTEVTSYMGYVNEPKSKATLDNRGLIGAGVHLRSRPKGPRVFDVYVRPSTRKHDISLDVEIAALGDAKGDVELKAELLDERGTVEKTFTRSVSLATATESPTVLARGVKRVTATWPWPDARLWDYRQPNLYTLRLTATCGGSVDQVVRTFGFREFWIEGRQFYLNNTPYNLRPQNLDYGAMPAQFLKDGYNFGELWPNDRGRRGSATYDDAVIAEADRIGFPVAAKAMHMGDYAANLAAWKKPEARAEWHRLMELDLRRWWNSPSVVMWAHTANAFQNPGDGDPRELGMTGLSNLQEQSVRHENAWQAIGMIKALDPLRPVYAHHGGDNGEVYTSNFYLNFIPLQEREEWMAYWARNGKLPFIAIEFGPPLYASLQRDKDGYTKQGHSEPSLTEWMAVYLGHDAYKLEPTDLRKIFTERYRGPKPGMDEEYSPHLRENAYDKILWASDSFVKFQNLFYRNTWRSWRTMGVSGMGVPWHQTDPKYFTDLYANNNDTLA